MGSGVRSGTELRVSHRLGKHSTPELYPGSMLLIEYLDLQNDSRKVT